GASAEGEEERQHGHDVGEAEVGAKPGPHQGPPWVSWDWIGARSMPRRWKKGPHEPARTATTEGGAPPPAGGRRRPTSRPGPPRLRSRRPRGRCPARAPESRSGSPSATTR